MQPQRRTTILALICVLLFGAVLNVTVSAQRSTFVSPVLVVNTSFLNVRTGPGSNYSIFTAVVGGTELPVLGISRDFAWYQVATHAGVGWVNNEFVLARGDFANVPFATATTPAGTTPFVVTSPVVVNLGQGGGGGAPTTSTTGSNASQTLNVGGGRTTTTGVSLNGDLKAEPSDASRTVFGPVVDPNLIYPVLDAANIAGTLWYKINFPGVGQVWTNKAQKRFLRCTPADTIGILRSRQQGLGIGTEGYIGPIVNNIASYELVDGGVLFIPFDQIAGRPDTVKSVCDGISTSAATTTTTTSTAGLGQGGGLVTTTFIPITTTNTVIVNTGQVNVRSGPGANYSIITRLPGGAELAIVGRAPDNVWYLVQGYFGQGWLNSEFVVFRGDFGSVPAIFDAYSGGGIITSVVPANLGQGGGGVVTTTNTVVNPPIPVFANNNHVVVNTGQLNVRSGPGPNFSVVATVPGGAELPILGRTNDTESWYLVQGYFGQGWVDSEFVVFRGDFSAVPVIDLN